MKQFRLAAAALLVGILLGAMIPAGAQSEGVPSRILRLEEQVAKLNDKTQNLTPTGAFSCRYQYRLQDGSIVKGRSLYRFDILKCKRARYSLTR